MVYIEKKIIKGKPYYYLTRNIRTGRNKWHKIRLYIGKGEIPKTKLEYLKKKYIKELNKKTDNLLRTYDVFYGMLTKNQILDLEKIKKNYIKFLKGKLPIDKKKFYEWFVTEFTYNTNAIEGSTMTLRDTGLLLFDKIMPSGRTTEEIQSAENNKKAYDYIMQYKGEVNKKFICEIHKILTHNILNKEHIGKFRKVQVYIRGAEFIPPKPKEVEEQFKNLMKWYKTNRKKYHPVVVASYLHAAFEGIHPFIDRNGRVGRLILDFTLHKNKYPPINIKYKEREKYYKALERAHKGNLKPFVNLLIKCLRAQKFD